MITTTTTKTRTTFERLAEYFAERYEFLTIRRDDGTRHKLYAFPPVTSVGDYYGNSREWLEYTVRGLLTAWGEVDAWQPDLIDRLLSFLWAGQGEIAWEDWFCLHWDLRHNLPATQGEAK